MGHEPFAAALSRGADVVLAGRATGTALVAAWALTRGLPPGPAWHAVKTVECGDQCSTKPRGGGVFVTIDQAWMRRRWPQLMTAETAGASSRARGTAAAISPAGTPAVEDH